MTTVDNYCANNVIINIDFLKLDIEGNEFSALKGCERMLTEKAIDLIQVEFGGCNIELRIFLRDFWELLHIRHGFNMYRILRDGLVVIDTYCEQLECFSGFNFLFVMKDKIDMNSISM